MAAIDVSDLGWLAALLGQSGVVWAGPTSVTRRREAAKGTGCVRAYQAAREVPPNVLGVTADATTYNALAARASGEAIYVGPQRRRVSGHGFAFVNNPDGTVRWLTACRVRRPLQLALYNSPTTKADLYAAIARMLTWCRLGHLLHSGQFTATFDVNGLLRRWLRTPLPGADDVAVFSGTRGDDRKVVVALGLRGVPTHFLKIPLGERTFEMLEHERATLKRLDGALGSAAVLPRVEDAAAAGGALMLASIRPQSPERTSGISKAHQAFLTALCRHTATLMPLETTAVFRRVSARLEARIPEAPELPRQQVATCLSLSRAIIHRIPRHQPVAVALAHGDFVPWNVFAEAGRLSVYDWELANEGPVFSDLFHYVCQSGVLVRRQSSAAILRTLNELIRHQWIQELAAEVHASVDLNFHLYLVDTATYYLQRYSHGRLHRQAGWLVQFWQDALQSCVGN